MPPRAAAMRRKVSFAIEPMKRRTVTRSAGSLMKWLARLLGLRRAGEARRWSGENMRIAGSAVTVSLAIGLGIAPIESLAQTRGVIIAFSPPHLGTMSFFFDDCGESVRGERFRTNYLDALNVCTTKLPDTVRMVDRTRIAIEDARVNRRKSPPVKPQGLCTEKPSAFWSLLESTEQKLEQWRTGTLMNEELAREICGRRD